MWTLSTTALDMLVADLVPWHCESLFADQNVEHRGFYPTSIQFGLTKRETCHRIISVKWDYVIDKHLALDVSGCN